MRITPRKAEITEIVALLESDDYDSADALAKDIIRRVGEVLAERDWYAYAFRFGPGSEVLTWGPLSSESEVKKFAAKLGVEGQHLTVRLNSTAAALTRMEEQSKDVVGKDATLCPNCGHPNGTHMHEKALGKCQLASCNCKSNS